MMMTTCHDGDDDDHCDDDGSNDNDDGILLLFSHVVEIPGHHALRRVPTPDRHQYPLRALPLLGEIVTVVVIAS